MSATLQHAAVVGCELSLVFADASELYLPLPMLRRACPCAACQGEPDVLGRIARPRIDHGPQAFELSRFHPVGGYALQLFWADGHSTGIYSFDYFRRLSRLPSS
jgi:DUF971 family protein